MADDAGGGGGGGLPPFPDVGAQFDKLSYGHDSWVWYAKAFSDHADIRTLADLADPRDTWNGASAVAWQEGVRTIANGLAAVSATLKRGAKVAVDVSDGLTKLRNSYEEHRKSANSLRGSAAKLQEQLEEDALWSIRADYGIEMLALGYGVSDDDCRQFAREKIIRLEREADGEEADARKVLDNLQKAAKGWYNDFDDLAQRVADLYWPQALPPRDINLDNARYDTEPGADYRSLEDEYLRDHSKTQEENLRWLNEGLKDAISRGDRPAGSFGGGRPAPQGPPQGGAGRGDPGTHTRIPE